MASDRIRRRIERLLDEADEAVARFDWSAVRLSAEAVLALDPENSDALAFLAGAERALGDQPPSDHSASTPSETTDPTTLTSSHDQVRRVLGSRGSQPVQTPLFLEGFLDYASKNPDVQLVKRFVCRARYGEKPRVLATLPSGKAYVYPEFLAFLTTSRGQPGGLAVMLQEVWQQMIVPSIHFAAWVSNPESILLDLARILGPDDPDDSFLNAGLSSPNSFFIAMRTIERVHRGRDLLQGNYIDIATSDGNFVLCEDVADLPNPILDIPRGKRPLKSITETFFPVSHMKAAYSRISGRWQRDVVDRLQEAARHNQSSTRA